MSDDKICGIFFFIGFVLGCIFGGIVWSWIEYEDNFKHGYGQALIDVKEGNSPKYKMFYRGDGTMTWVVNKEGVK